ncbi:hypothetical protein EBR96_07220, partial [bacterium]|nr:hypothetical protein [bacterium]
MADWLTKLAHLTRANHLKIKEYGAGLGVLAQLILERLNKTSSNFSYVISEYSANAIAQLEASIPTHRLGSNVQFRVEDILSNASEPDSTNLIILNYLLDSLPTDQLVWDGNQLQEIWVESALDGNSPIIDSVHFPPRFVGANEITEWMSELSLIEAAFMAPTLSERINESFHIGTINN